jgi:hypothetical protein
MLRIGNLILNLADISLIERGPHSTLVRFISGIEMELDGDAERDFWLVADRAFPDSLGAIKGEKLAVATALPRRRG